tara:strand:+ start:3696 stop:3860 length:165 start_codon:yes stop_codon:yes gene_type:complete
MDNIAKCEWCSKKIRKEESLTLEVDPEFNGETEIYFCDEDCGNEMVTGMENNWK